MPSKAAAKRNAMMDRKQVRLGLVGYGEVGSTLGQGLRNEGLIEIAAYDKYAFDGPFDDLIQSRAAAAGVPLVQSPQELAARSEIILGVTPGKASVESAEAFAPHLAPEHVFVDLASATPKVKQSAGRALRASNANFADASIMGTPHVDGHRLPILTSGPAAERFRDLMSPWGLKIEHVQGDLGAASGIKIMRSVIAKGLEALLVECVLGARHYGIDEAVLSSFGKFMDSRSFQEVANFLLVTDVIHAERRSQEARISVDALEEVGVDAIMTRATAERLEWVTGLQTKAHLGGIVPAHYTQAIEAIETLLKQRKAG
jgi:3-hydroxyisobutyrate dehydrogenase-like beta-hydroxyacid dehydrogenase